MNSHHASFSSSRRTRGFTIVELLVVITLIAVLLAMLAPSLRSARELAVSMQCASNMRQIDVAGSSYTLDSKESMPYGAYQIALVGSPPTACYSWDDLTDSYMGGTLNATDLALNGVTTKLNILICPRDPNKNTPGGAVRSYAINNAIGGNNFAAFTLPAGTPTYPPTSAKLFQISAPSSTLFFVEAPNYISGQRGRTGGNSDLRYPAEQDSYIIPSGTNMIAGMTGVGTHPRDTFNYAFIDGHIAAMYPTDTDGIYVSTLPRGISTGIPNHWAWTATGAAKGFWSINPND